MQRYKIMFKIYLREFKLLDSFQLGGALLPQMSEISLRMIQDAVKLSTTNLMSQNSCIYVDSKMDGVKFIFVFKYIEVFEELKKLLQNLEQNLYTNLSKLFEEDEQSIKEYDDRRVHLVEYSNKLKRTENKLRDHITTYIFVKINNRLKLIVLVESQEEYIICKKGEIFDSATRIYNDLHQNMSRQLKLENTSQYWLIKLESNY